MERVVSVQKDEATKNIAELMLRSDRRAKESMTGNDRLKREPAEGDRRLVFYDSSHLHKNY